MKMFNQDRVFSYDALDQLIGEKDHKYTFDSNYSLLSENSATAVSNNLDELTQLGAISCSYDLRGNLIAKETPSGTFRYSYDALNRLIQADTPSGNVCYSYDSLGRLLSKNEERYLWDDMTEIGTFTAGKSPTALRILGPSYTKPAFIELVTESFSPVSDSLGNLRLLIDSSDNASAFDYTAFGEPKTACECPWNYVASRYDPETGLYYNLSRYYDPIVKRWLSGDTAGFVDSMNLYAYVLNNPCRYIDPQGKFVFMIPILIFGGEITAALICDALITSAIVGTLSFGAAHLENYVNNSLSSPPPSFFDVQQGGYGNGFDLEERLLKKKKSEDVYVPDRPLPNHPNGAHMPDADAPHTQLGTKEGRYGKYPQAREFDEKGNAVKDIDFTDHGYPHQHPNPHQHIHQPNKTGGTPKRGDPEPVAYGLVA